MSFEAFFLDPDVLSAIRQMGYVTPTPIQELAIPHILAREDVIALAETGSGKTATCAIPICHQIDVNNGHIQAVIIVPTRELALQYATEAQKIGAFKRVKVFAVLGGEDIELQRAKLKDGVHLLVATPGRLIDFIYQRAIDLSHVKTVVLDEADEMLSMGFFEDIEFILNCMIQEHATLLFSATMPKEILKLARHAMKSPKELSLISERASPKQLTHEFFYSHRKEQKADDLVFLLRDLKVDQCLIFVNFRHEAEKVYHKLKKHLDSVDFLHGGLDQSIRNIVMNKFSKAKIRYLVATDIASRGLDVSRITHVINLHLPMDKESYLHRTGRTARVGREGVAITFVTKEDMRRLTHFVEKPHFLNEPPPPPRSNHRR